MKIVIFGTGGVGGYFGGKLTQAGNDVTFLARGKHLKAIEKNGLSIRSIQGDFTIHPANVTSDPKSIGKADLVILSVKSWQLKEIADGLKSLCSEKRFQAICNFLKSLCSEKTIFLPLENGISAPDVLKDIVAPHLVLGGLCKIFSYIKAPGIICHSGYQPSITFGELDNAHSERVQQISDILDQACIKNHIAENIETEMWKKFLFIVGTSALGAITLVPIGTFRSIPESRSVLKQVLDEIVSVGKGLNVILPENIADKTLSFIDQMPEDATTSLQRDIMEGKPSELDAQLGEVVRRGEKLNISTPALTIIYITLLPKEKLARGLIG